MFRTYKTLLAIRIASGANRTIYYAQKLPLIGKRISDDWYSLLPVKRAAAVIALIAMILWGFLSRALFVGLLVYLPTTGLSYEALDAAVNETGALHEGGTIGEGGGIGEKPADAAALFLHIFFLLSFIVAGVSSASVLEPKKEKYIAVKLMRMAPSRYMKATLGYRYVTFFLFLLPSLMLFGAFAGISLIKSAMLAAAVTMWRVGCEYAHLLLFRKTGIILIRKTGAVWAVILAGYFLAYAPLLLDWPPFAGAVAIHPLFLAAAVVIGAQSAALLARYKEYGEAVDAAARRDDPLLDIRRMMVEAQKADVQMRDDDITAADRAYRTGGTGSGDGADSGVGAGSDRSVGLGGFGGLAARGSGYVRLNAIFFARHRRVVSRPFYRRLAIAGGVGAALILAALFLPDTIGTWLDRLQVSMLALILLMMSVGERICRAMFYNCDISLMRYPFYRKDAAKHFRVRLKRITLQNIGIAAALCALLTIAMAIGGRPLEGYWILMLWTSGLTLSVFFSVHYLFIYYILQPYATETHTKNPFYHVLNYFVSFSSAICFFRPISDTAFTAAVVVLTVFYIGISFLLVRKYGSRTFRVK